MSTVPVPVDVLSALLSCTDRNAEPEDCEKARAYVDDLLGRPVSGRFLVVSHDGKFLLVDTEVVARAGFGARVLASGYREQIVGLAAALNGSPEALDAWAQANDVPEEPF